MQSRKRISDRNWIKPLSFVSVHQRMKWKDGNVVPQHVLFLCRVLFLPPLTLWEEQGPLICCGTPLPLTFLYSTPFLFLPFYPHPFLMYPFSDLFYPSLLSRTFYFLIKFSGADIVSRWLRNSFSPGDNHWQTNMRTGGEKQKLFLIVGKCQ